MILGGMVLSAALSGLAKVLPGNVTRIAFATAALSALSFMLTTMRWALKPEKRWYAGRTVAESVKTLAWRFVMGVDPYPLTLTPDAAGAQFLADLRATIQGQGQAALGLGSEFTNHPQITAKMRDVRAGSLEQRRDLYVIERIQDQRRWYGSAAQKNQRRATAFYVVIQMSQAGALASSALLVSPYMSNWDFAGLFPSLASALLGWMHMRQYEDLAQSYAVAALDLGLTEEKAANVRTEVDLAALVADAEATVGRERSRWASRRE